MSDKTTKEIAFETGGKVVVTIFGFFMLKNILSNVFTEPGLTTRVKFDLGNTQVRKIWVGGTQGWHEVADPWKPDDLAHKLHTAMSGLSEPVDVNFQTSRKPLWDEVGVLGIDRARWLHNYWLDKVDPEDTLWRWIDGEWADFGEWDAKDAAMNMLTRAGVGW